MKKVLLASTALVAFGGAAYAADSGITLSGYAEIGVDGGNNRWGAPDATTGVQNKYGYDTQFHNDWQVNFNFAGTTDNGVEFGGTVQLEDLSTDPNPNNDITGGVPNISGSNRVNGAVKIDDEAFWVSGDFGKVTLGDTDGALDWAVPEIYTGTAISDDQSTHAGAYWNTGLDGIYDNQVARYEYSFGDWAVAGSVEMFDLNSALSGQTLPDGSTFVNQDMAWGLGAKWNGDMSGAKISAGVGYQSDGDLSTWSIAGTAALDGGFSFGVGYAAFDGSDGNEFVDYVGNGVEVDRWFGIEAAYVTGPMTFAVNYGQYNAIQNVDNPSGWGFVANYDMGGGAVAMFGYGDSMGSQTNSAGQSIDYAAGNGHGSQTWSAGIGMSF